VNRIVGDRHTVINNGIPSDRVAAATHHDVRQIGVRDVNTLQRGPDSRNERLSADGRTLNVFRPNLVPTNTKRGVRMGGVRSDQPHVLGAAEAQASPYRPGGVTGRVPVGPGEPLILRGADRTARGTEGGAVAGPSWPQNYSYRPLAMNERNSGEATAQEADQAVRPQTIVPRIGEYRARQPSRPEVPRSGGVGYENRYNGYPTPQRQYQYPSEAYRQPPAEVPRYQPSAPERPRYEPGQPYSPQRNLNPPPQDYRAAPAQSAPSAPSAPARQAPQPSQPARSDRSGR
jgi:hypothetical protein